MRKRSVGLIVGGILLVSAAVSGMGDSQSSKSNEVQADRPSQSTEQAEKSNTQPAPKMKPICDGTSVTTGCTVDGISYVKYVYHPAVAQKSHVETSTSYQKQVTGSCTLCVDGTYSPTCATGRGACSHHGGVAQWNAPVYSTVPVQTSQTVVDAAAQDAYYEKVAG